MRKKIEILLLVAMAIFFLAGFYSCNTPPAAASHKQWRRLLH